MRSELVSGCLAVGGGVNCYTHTLARTHAYAPTHHPWNESLLGRETRPRYVCGCGVEEGREAESAEERRGEFESGLLGSYTRVAECLVSGK